MKRKSAYALLAFGLFFCAALVAGAILLIGEWGGWTKAAFVAFGALGAAALFFFFLRRSEAAFKSAFLLVAFAFAVFAVLSLLHQTLDLAQYAGDGEKIERIVRMIRDSGKWGMLVYILFQILQVVLLPLPAAVCYLSGAQVWHPLTATVIASIGVLIGSLINYLLGKFFGKRVIDWIAGKNTADRYLSFLGRRGKTLFVLMQILPFFPDDVLCLLAGFTRMSFPFFLSVMVLVRPAIIAVYCFLGGGEIIPFSGWGIPVWAAIVTVCALLALLSLRYQDRFEAYLKRRIVGSSARTHAADAAETPAEKDARLPHPKAAEGEATAAEGGEGEAKETAKTPDKQISENAEAQTDPPKQTGSDSKIL